MLLPPKVVKNLLRKCFSTDRSHCKQAPTSLSELATEGGGQWDWDMVNRESVTKRRCFCHLRSNRRVLANMKIKISPKPDTVHQFKNITHSSSQKELKTEQLWKKTGSRLQNSCACCRGYLFSRANAIQDCCVRLHVHCLRTLKVN